MIRFFWGVAKRVCVNVGMLRRVVPVTVRSSTVPNKVTVPTSCLRDDLDEKDHTGRITQNAITCCLIVDRTTQVPMLSTILFH